MRILAALPFLLSVGCFTTDLDPTAAGVFACNDDPDGACPDDQMCVNGRCEVGDLPDISVQFPENEQNIGLGGVAIGGRQTIEINLTTTLDLVPEGGDHVFGEGHLEVSADGQAPVIVTTGAGIVNVELDLDNIIGAHRISVRAIRNDGTRYDHPEATENRLFWISDSQTRPLVGIKSPWPGEEFPLDTTEIEVEAAVFGGFLLQAANPDGGSSVLTGHVHIYYAQAIESCIVDPDCDKDYLATIVAPTTLGATSGIAPLTIPDSGAGTFPLSVVLRNIDHSLYLHDATPDEVGDEVPVLDEITIVRR